MKQVFLYNLKPEITDEQYDQFLRSVKGPIISRMEHNISFNMLRMDKFVQGPCAYKYIGIVEITDLENWAKDCSTPDYQAFQAEWAAMVEGEFVYWEGKDIGLWINPAKTGDTFKY